MRLIIVSGLSGSGKTVALHHFEDLGFYCIDNMPVGLLATLLDEITATQDPLYDNLAIGIDARNRATDLARLPEMVRDLRKRGVRCEVIFLHADDNALLKRYGETRRKHPLSAAGLSLREAIDRERQLLGPIIASAELVLDTTRTSVYDLRDIIRRRVGAHEQPGLSILIESFGYKHGIPADADFVFDLRCLPNPYWDLALRSLTGKDDKVAAFLDASAPVQRMYADILGFLDRWIPVYIDFSRNYLTVAVGCTGGQHRSVYMAEKLAAELAKRYSPVMTRHNELPETEGRIQVPQFGGLLDDAS
ncbi:MAG: RNase adapter RapZ [Gammaproteobacteria bacterium]|nr:RNase adapter RapZ [Gammaproteobacteria bacterium]